MNEPERASRLRGVPEVAEYLQLHEQTVRTLIRSGELGSVRVGRRIFVRDDQLDAFIDAHTINAAC